ncbi:hypothetical protein KP509_34G020200 [Ceratopteris richardii]|uniref:Plus3 domain-containing protein n=1 Tax=Ceratopteris richardii TaxID=49495 RepID=A0A8T2QIU5_CERRI|nr:hypothetical protein KP509_34G020200 [Ceratopteris richardii]
MSIAEDSLDDELLAAVGRSSGGRNERKNLVSSRASSKRGRQDLSSDEEDSDDEPSVLNRESDDGGDDSEVDEAGASSARRGHGSRMPLKKRYDKDDNDAFPDGYDSDLSFGSDLYKNDEDREFLHNMNELEREMILHDRGERREAFLARNKKVSRLKRGVRDGVDGSGKKKDHRSQTPPSTSRMRSSTRECTKVNPALDKLLLRKRQKDQDFGHHRTSSARGPSPPIGDESDDARVSDNESEEQENEEDHPDHPEGDLLDADDPTLEDIFSVTIRRSRLAKWFLEPFFEEVIAGCFVRVGVGVKDGVNCYRLCQVKNVDASDPYKQYKFENRMTHKWLNLVWGDSEARWQMARISDQPPTQAEFEQWDEEVKKSPANLMPTLLEITKKKDEISNLSTFIYSAEKVKKMLHEKKMSLSRPLNVAAEKDRLLKELALAESNDDQDQAERIQTRLRELEAYSMQNQSKDAKAMALAQMNKRNRFENFKNASDLKPVSQAKAGEAGYDPFSRRWTRSQNYYSRSTKPENTEVVKAVEAVTEAAREAAKDAGKLTDTQAPVKDSKVSSLHDFPLKISLAGIQKYGGAQGAHLAYIARKQRLEATCEVPVERSDSRRHILTLTVNDYKRRRGLL